MSNRSLGQLTLDLVARIGGFTGPMDQASRHSQRRSREIQRSMQDAADSIKNVLGTLAIGAGFAAITRATVDFQNEQAQLGAVLRSTGEAAGYNQQQLNAMASAMSSVSTVSAGEINQAQTTLLAFTGIVGDEFPRALQAAVDMAARTGTSVVSAAETVGRALDVPSKGLAALSRQGFRFTEDQKKLAEYLESTGRTAEAQAIILAALEDSYGAAAQAARETLGGALAALGNAFQDLITGEDGVERSTEAINELTDTLSDPRIKAAFDVIVGGVIEVTTAIAKALPELVGFTTWAAEELAAFAVGIAPDDIVRLERDAERIRGVLQGGLLNFGERIRFFGNKGLVEYWSEDELKTELGQLQQTIDAYYASQAKKPVQVEGPKAAPVAVNEAALLAEARAAEASAKAAKEAARQREAALKAAERAAQAIWAEVEALQFQAATLGKSTQEVRLLALANKGATAEQLALASAAMETVAAYEDAEEKQRAYQNLLSDLRTDEERLTDQMRERLAVLDAMSDISESERNRVASRVAAQATAEAPRYGGLDAVVGGPFGELAKIDEAQSRLADWYSAQLSMLEQFRRERADLTAAWDAEERAVKEQHEAELARIEQARQQAQLVAAESLFGDLAGLARTYAGEQSTIYRAMFTAQKAAAIAQAAIAIQQGVAMAAANPWPTNLAAMASVAAATAGIVGNIAAIGMAHDGIDSIPKTGTWILEKGERVTTAQTSAKLDRTLDEIRGGGGGSQRPMQFNISLPGVTDPKQAQQSSAAIRRAVAQGVAQSGRYT